jgi:3-oxoacyl-[acyl-carrier protein] reductase
VLFTSGQHLAPMPNELPYAISKGAVHQMTSSLGDALADRAITVNAINPDPLTLGGPPQSCARSFAQLSPLGAGAVRTTSQPSSAGSCRRTAPGSPGK